VVNAPWMSLCPRGLPRRPGVERWMLRSPQAPKFVALGLRRARGSARCGAVVTCQCIVVEVLIGSGTDGRHRAVVISLDLKML